MLFRRLSSSFLPLSSLLLCAGLSACGYFIPPEKSTARYNTVIGEPRRPALNPAPGQSPTPASTPSNASDQGAMAPTFPPVSPETQARAAEEIASNDIAPPAGAAPAPIALARHVPEDNASAAVVAASDYPSLNSVPQSTSLDHDAAARLARVKAELEEERAQAATQKGQLDHDAAIESTAIPSNNAVVPPPEPIAVAPVPAPNTGVPSVTVPANNMAPTRIPTSSAVPVINAPMPASTPSGYIAGNLPPPPPMPLGNIPYAPAPMTAMPAAVPTVTTTTASAQEPIILHPPTPVPNTSTTQQTYTPMASSVRYATDDANANGQPMPAAAPGGFDPLAGANSSGYSVYSNGGYLPASRYSQVR